jgi:hypothetical protein
MLIDASARGRHEPRIAALNDTDVDGCCGSHGLATASLAAWSASPSLRTRHRPADAVAADTSTDEVAVRSSTGDLMPSPDQRRHEPRTRALRIRSERIAFSGAITGP